MVQVAPVKPPCPQFNGFAAGLNGYRQIFRLKPLRWWNIRLRFLFGARGFAQEVERPT